MVGSGDTAPAGVPQADSRRDRTPFRTLQASKDQVGVSQAVISKWISGERTPAYENRKELLAQYGIGLDAWEQPAQKHDVPAFASYEEKTERQIPVVVLEPIA